MMGVSPRLAEAHGDVLIRRFREIEKRPEGDLAPYPPQPPRAPRPAPEVEAAFEALKSVRNQVAAEVGLDRGRVMANHLIMEIATTSPSDAEQLLAAGDIRKWQADLMGSRLIAALRQEEVESRSGAGS
jgi:ribonuclease D